MQMNDDPEDRERVDPLVVVAEVQAPRSNLSPARSRRMIGSTNAM